MRHDHNCLHVILELPAQDLSDNLVDVGVFLGSNTFIWWHKVTLYNVYLEFEVPTHEEAVEAFRLEIIVDFLNLPCIHLLARLQHPQVWENWLVSQH